MADDRNQDVSHLTDANMPSKVFVAAGISKGMEAKLARIALGLAQWQVAQKAGVAQWAISAYERQERYVPPGWVAKIRAALGLEEAH